MDTIAPLSGWILDFIAEHDLKQPGFAGHFLRASAERRQIIAAHFAVRNGAPHGGLIRKNHRNILIGTFGHVPTGLRRALAKSGSQPHDQSYYTDLYDGLAFGLRHVVAAIMAASHLNPERLEVIRALPADLCDSRIVERIENIQQARDLITIVGLFETRTGNRKRLVDALLASRNPLEIVIRRWCRRIEYSDHPLEECVGYRPIRNGIELHEVARRYQNCGRNYTAATLMGENAFGEFVALDGRRVLLCFDRSDGNWTLEGVYGRRNRPLPDDLEMQARAFTRMHGILGRWQSNRSHDDIGQALARLILPYSRW